MEKIINKIKENKLLKYGLLAALVLIIVIVIVSLVAGSGSAKAEKFVKEYFSEQMRESEEVKISTKTVNKNKGKKLYIVRTEISAKTPSGDAIESTAFVMVKLQKDNNYIVNQFPYSDSESQEKALDEATKAMVDIVNTEE